MSTVKNLLSNAASYASNAGGLNGGGGSSRGSPNPGPINVGNASSSPNTSPRFHEQHQQQQQQQQMRRQQKLQDDQDANSVMAGYWEGTQQHQHLWNLQHQQLLEQPQQVQVIVQQQQQQQQERNPFFTPGNFQSPYQSQKQFLENQEKSVLAQIKEGQRVAAAYTSALGPVPVQSTSASAVAGLQQNSHQATSPSLAKLGASLSAAAAAGLPRLDTSRSFLDLEAGAFSPIDFQGLSPTPSNASPMSPNGLSPLTPTTPSTTAAAKKRNRTSKNHTPRPSNSFILYRREKHGELMAQYQGQKSLNNNVISKIVATLWRNESVEVKAKFAAMADAEKKAHLLKYPDYKYQPKKTPTKKSISPVTKSIAGGSGVSKKTSSPVKQNAVNRPIMQMNQQHSPLQAHHPQMMMMVGGQIEQQQLQQQVDNQHFANATYHPVIQWTSSFPGTPNQLHHQPQYIMNGIPTDLESGFEMLNGMGDDRFVFLQQEEGGMIPSPFQSWPVDAEWELGGPASNMQ